MSAGLIQMNVHMVMDKTAICLVAYGVAIVLIFGIMAVVIAINGESWKGPAFLAVFAAVGLIVMLSGLNRPRVKEIKVCASGPISIEEVASVYEIRKIDGKELTLRER